jgi:predicted transcriptional regulator
MIEDEMTIEMLKQKIEQQAQLIRELTNENELLFHQYNHLIIRNGKMLKRIDDLQSIINDLHVRIEELHLINGNMMSLNDNLRKKTLASGPGDIRPAAQPVDFNLNVEDINRRWKEFPGQVSQNAPNLHKQMVMLMHLYMNSSMRADELFNKTGVGGVTGARYVSALKKFELIRFTGARKKGYYEITRRGKEFIEAAPKTYGSGL